jgi:hypothetical protein
MATGLQTPILDDVLEKYKNAIEQGMMNGDWTAVNKI